MASILCLYPLEIQVEKINLAGSVHQQSCLVLCLESRCQNLHCWLWDRTLVFSSSLGRPASFKSEVIPYAEQTQWLKCNHSVELTLVQGGWKNASQCFTFTTRGSGLGLSAILSFLNFYQVYQLEQGRRHIDKIRLKLIRAFAVSVCEMHKMLS